MKKKFRFAAAFVTGKNSGGTCMATLHLKSNTINRHEVIILGGNFFCYGLFLRKIQFLILYVQLYMKYAGNFK